MAQPSNSTVTIDGSKFNALASQMGVHTQHDHHGMPQMGTLHTTISCVIDVHDTENVPFTTLKKLWDLANVATRDKIKEIKIEYWCDENQNDAICSFKFQGLISSFTLNGGGGGNHVASLQIQPSLDQKQYVDIALGN